MEWCPQPSRVSYIEPFERILFLAKAGLTPRLVEGTLHPLAPHHVTDPSIWMRYQSAGPAAEELFTGRDRIVLHRRQPLPESIASRVVKPVQNYRIQTPGQVFQLGNRQALGALAQACLNIQNVNRQPPAVESHALPVRNDPGVFRRIDNLAQLAQRPAQGGFGIIRQVPKKARRAVRADVGDRFPPERPKEPGLCVKPKAGPQSHSRPHAGRRRRRFQDLAEAMSPWLGILLGRMNCGSL